jgi:hypothetical protein
MNVIWHRVVPKRLPPALLTFFVENPEEFASQGSVKMRNARMGRPNEVVVQLVKDVRHRQPCIGRLKAAGTMSLLGLRPSRERLGYRKLYLTNPRFLK